MADVLESTRLSLQPLAASEAHRALYRALYGDHAVMRLVAPTVPDARMATSFEASVEESSTSAGLPTRWCLRHRAHGQGIGLAGSLHADGAGEVELGVLLLPGFHGQGYAREALSTLIDAFARRVDVTCFWARHHAGNVAMARVLGQLDFTRGPAIDGLWRWERQARPAPGR